MQAIFLELIKLSLIGSLFAVAVMLVRLILPKTPKWIFCLLWGIVALRLICPISIESRFSLVPDRIASGQIIASVGNEYIGDVNIIHENDDAYDSALEAGRQPVSAGDGYYVVTEKDSLEAPKTVGMTLYPILSWIWAAGALVMLGYTAISYLLLRRKMAEATLLRDNIWQCEQVDSPFVLGFVKPKIYLPYTITDSDMANVIAHEKAHIHRKDHWWKPIGFILLSIHWFNPVLWLAYILLCRDIEAACDEKVIKHMEKDEMRAYSTALLNCSVNRRRIAACPLAFGEVGVKERVKTVMNYKKPAFWIVIAAIALCVVVAVCFLTNPKDKGPQVGNPQMLEFPGVAWFATPDEVKEALNITEEQIIEEYTTSGYILEMWVTDLTLYGRDVPFAKFSFWFDNNGNTALRRASVCFSEDTDMNKLKKELIEIYGPGKAEAYRYSLYDNNTDRNGRFGRRISSLEAAAENEIYQNGVEGNPFQDALEDPDYMTHHWVAENGTSFIPEEVVEYFRSAEDEQMPQDEDAFMEKLDQMPWVVISMANRHAAAIINEIKGTEYEWEALQTNNCMTFSADLLAEYLYTAQTANPGTTPTEVDDPTMLEFPGIQWGATPEEVKTALNLTDAQILRDEAVGDGWDLRIADVTFFGKEVSIGVFSFHRYGSNEFGLNSVNLFYPDETDMTVVNDSLAALYGAPKDSMGFTRYQVKQGKITPYTDAGITLTRYEGQKTQLINWWESTAKQADAFPAEVQEAIIASGILSSSGDRVDPADPSSRDVVLEFLAKEPAVFLFCTDSAKVGNPSSGFTKNVVSFDASDYRSQIEYHTRQSDYNTTDTPDAAMHDASLLEFPGLKWNSSVSEVKKALNLKKEQILVDEMAAEEGQEFDVWVLTATGIEIFGFEPEVVRFTFIRYPGNDYGLLNISLDFPGSADTNVIRDNMMAVYGKGTTERAPSYSFNEEGLLEEVDPDTIVKSGDAEEGYPYYWFSTVNGIETMSAEALERYIEYALNNNNLGIKQEAVVDYLEKTSAVQVTCMAWTTKEITRVTFYANMLAHNWQQFGK